MAKNLNKFICKFRSAFRPVSVLAILCAAAIVALYTWALIRVIDERGILDASRPLSWIDLWGRMGDCSQICESLIKSTDFFLIFKN